MDILRIKGEFLTEKIKEIVERIIRKNGYSSKFDLTAIEVTEMADGSFKAHLNVDITIPKEDITRYLQLHLWK